MITITTAPICAVVYPTEVYPHDLFRGVVDDARARGLSLAGLVQHDRAVPGRRKCDMDLEDLATGRIMGISEYRGEAASGCRLDVSALLLAGGAAGQQLAETRPALMVLNKFGKLEAEGGGLIPLIAACLESGVPLLIGVPERNREAFAAFAGPFAETVRPDRPAVLDWLARST